MTNRSRKVGDKFLLVCPDTGEVNTHKVLSLAHRTLFSDPQVKSEDSMFFLQSSMPEILYKRGFTSTDVTYIMPLLYNLELVIQLGRIGRGKTHRCRIVHPEFFDSQVSYKKLQEVMKVHADHLQATSEKNRLKKAENGIYVNGSAPAEAVPDTQSVEMVDASELIDAYARLELAQDRIDELEVEVTRLKAELNNSSLAAQIQLRKEQLSKS